MLTVFKLSRDSNIPYPSYESLRRRSHHSCPDDGFEDLHCQDFIRVAGHVSQHKLALLDIPDYQRGLLQQGVTHRVEEEARSVDLWLGMEYLSAIGITLMDEMADVNEQVSDCLDLVIDQVQEALRDVGDMDARLEEERVRGDRLEGELAETRRELNELKAIVRGLSLWRTTMQHGPGNLIIVRATHTLSS